MVNLSHLATAAGASAGATAGAAAAAGVDAGAPRVGRAAVRARSAAAESRKSSAHSLLAQVAQAAFGRAAGGSVMRSGARSVAVPGWVAAARAAPKTASSSAKVASSKAPSTSSTSSLAFLSDPRLSIEEKLMRLMAYLNGKWEKEMEAKMKQVAGEDGKASSTSSSSTKKKTGIFGSIASAIAGAGGGGALSAVSGFLKIPGVKAVVGKIAGPVLAAGASALGFPAAAPLLLKYGSNIVDAVAGVASAAGSSSSSGTSGAGGTSGTKELSDADRQLLMTQIQRLQDKQKEMFGLVSNILKGNHDTRMAVINNLR